MKKQELANVQRRLSYVWRILATRENYRGILVDSLLFGIFLFIFPWFLIGEIGNLNRVAFISCGIFLYATCAIGLFFHFVRDDRASKKQLSKTIEAIEKHVSSGMAESIRIPKDELFQCVKEPGELVKGEDVWGELVVYRTDHDQTSYLVQFLTDEEFFSSEDALEVVRLTESCERVILVYHRQPYKEGGTLPQALYLIKGIRYDEAS